MTTFRRTDREIAWLLSSADPSVRYLTLTEVLDERPSTAEVQRERRQILEGHRMQALLQPRSRDNGQLVHPYQKWTGAHWRLVSMVELGVPPDESRAHETAERVLDWLLSDQHRSHIRAIRGRVRRCASQEGNAVGACSRLGLAGDDRVRRLAADLCEWQWPDGGWNCDRRPDAQHSSFHETLPALWGLVEFARATGDASSNLAVVRAAELLLRHRLFRHAHSDDIIDRRWLSLRYPPYWHYDILQALLVLSRAGCHGDPRAADALQAITSKRRSDGTWAADGAWWKATTGTGTYAEVVDWGRRGPNEMVTLNALRVIAFLSQL